MTPINSRHRVRASITGTVQGVGFRPYVFKLATDLNLAGFVLNDARGVLVEVEGDRLVIDQFFERLRAEAPPLASVDAIWRNDTAPTGAQEFLIMSSVSDGAPSALVAPDSATCEECLLELRDRTDRRFRYPFINCTNCGPRFSIVRDIPYDRPLTTMAGFVMCTICHAEYTNPADRRFHAEPNACPACGPVMQLTDGAGRLSAMTDGCDPVGTAASALAMGAVIAVKGIGGYHLACAADDQTAVAALRARKNREDKPFAVMVADLECANRLIDLDPDEAALLGCRARPIVLGRRRVSAPVAHSVAPRSHELGVMLPYSALHHLLLNDFGAPLVMTSGNRSDEPIAFRDDDALHRLAGIADLFLRHNRPIHVRTDDSVARVVAIGTQRQTVLHRRSRGYVPAALELPVETRPLVACGAELKNTFCVAKGRRAWVSHHVGDLKNHETLQSFHEGIAHFERLFAVRPEVVVHDMHPDYLSTTFAESLPDVLLVAVQHHHAHLAACLAEHGESASAVGAIYDGAGYGLDGTVWGGELLYGGLTGVTRVGHLWPVRMPGGDQATREPWRMACSWLIAATGEDQPDLPAALFGRVDHHRWEVVSHLVRTGLSAPVTTSVGRLFDAVAALAGVAITVQYEGQAAVELEALASTSEAGGYDIPIIGAQTTLPAHGLLLDARDAVLTIAREVAAGVSASTVSARFHNGLASATARACTLAAEAARTDRVVLSGGVFQNRRLLERTASLLTTAGLRVMTPARLPANDGGIAFGQAVVAAATASSTAHPVTVGDG